MRGVLADIFAGPCDNIEHTCRSSLRLRPLSDSVNTPLQNEYLPHFFNQLQGLVAATFLTLASLQRPCVSIWSWCVRDKRQTSIRYPNADAAVPTAGCIYSAIGQHNVESITSTLTSPSSSNTFCTPRRMSMALPSLSATTSFCSRRCVVVSRLSSRSVDD